MRYLMINLYQVADCKKYFLRLDGLAIRIMERKNRVYVILL